MSSFLSLGGPFISYINITMKRAPASAITVLVAISSCSAFHSPVGRQPLRLRTGHVGQFQPNLHGNARLVVVAPRGDVSVGFFRDLLKKFKGGDEEEDEEERKVADKSTNVVSAADVVSNEKEDKEEEASISEEKAAVAAEATPVESKEEDEEEEEEEEEPAPIEKSLFRRRQPKVEVVKEAEVLSPKAEAEKLRAQAARIRLEADKRQVELTLEKIDKLNIKLEKMKTQENVNPKDQKSLEEELQLLKSRLVTDEQGGTKPAPVPVVAAKSEASSAETDAPSTTSSSSQSGSDTSSPHPPLSVEEMEERVKKYQEAPEFMKILVAKTVGFGVDSDTPGAVDRLNATDIVQKLYDDEMDYERINVKSDSEMREMIERAYENSPSEFTEEQIQAKIKELDDIPQFIKNLIDKDFNDTEVATMLLEEDSASKKKGGFFNSLFDEKDDKKGEVGRDGERMDVKNPGTFSRFFSDDSSLNETSYGQSKTDLSFLMESLYPKSTRKEDETPDKRQADAFMNDIVAPTKAFLPDSNPVSVPGGWIIRGKNKCASGDELIEKLDRRMANDSRLREKISFFLLKDPFPDSEQILDPLNWPEVLFVAGPDVARDSEVILRTAISSIGIATAWYGSIYPFLANPKLLDRATDAMDLADAGMSTDLSWLSEMSIPLFVSFMALQVTHEIAHQVVAKTKNFEANVPTIIPSIVSGTTNSITSLKTSPKNKQDLVDFAVAGPLVGMIGSLLVLCYGLDLTAAADAATVQSFPGLPLAVLRQSSLGGGLIDLFLGNGVLNVPASAEGAQALASTLIALHPLAVAGFFSLVVNALALVPAGRTDGGRISMALFGRSGSQAVTFVSLACLAILGFGFESDLLLLYFAFITFFQSELEIPCRNEVDDVDFSRVILAGIAGFLMLLTLIPMS